MKFDAAFAAVVDHEGGYVNDSRDPGGETKYGISKRQYPRLDIKNLTLEQARVIYKRDYWAVMRCDELPDVVAFHVFDAAVNNGVGQAVRFLQRAAGVADDGWLGQVTMDAVAKTDHDVLTARISGHRLEFLTKLSTWDAYGRGWARRMAKNLKEM